MSSVDAGAQEGECIVMLLTAIAGSRVHGEAHDTRHPPSPATSVRWCRHRVCLQSSLAKGQSMRCGGWMVSTSLIFCLNNARRITSRKRPRPRPVPVPVQGLVQLLAPHAEGRGQTKGRSYATALHMNMGS